MANRNQLMGFVTAGPAVSRLGSFVQNREVRTTTPVGRVERNVDHDRMFASLRSNKANLTVEKVAEAFAHIQPRKDVVIK